MKVTLLPTSTDFEEKGFITLDICATNNDGIVARLQEMVRALLTRKEESFVTTRS